MRDYPTQIKVKEQCVVRKDMDINDHERISNITLRHKFVRDQLVEFDFKNNVHVVYNRIVGVIVSMLASSAVDCRFDPRLGQTKEYKISICCFSVKHAA
jgi:hypothetical protein